MRARLRCFASGLLVLTGRITALLSVLMIKLLLRAGLILSLLSRFLSIRWVRGSVTLVECPSYIGHGSGVVGITIST
jgi:hypothetical protein